MDAPPRPAKVGGNLGPEHLCCFKMTEPCPGSSKATDTAQERSRLILQENNVRIKNRTLTILNYLHDSL